MSYPYPDTPDDATVDDFEQSRPARKTEPTPLPKIQLAVIYAIKLTLPIALSQSIPYYNVLIEKLAASEGAVTGYYSGLAVSTNSSLALVHCGNADALCRTVPSRFRD